MTAVRQDAWSPEDDLILAEVTLRHIREGSTQLTAFEEVGERIGRTAAACGFRWNSCVRKRYDSAIQVAKAQRQKRNYLRKQPVSTGSASIAGLVSLDFEDTHHYKQQEHLTEDTLSIDAVIRYLKGWKNSIGDNSRQLKYLEKQLHDKEEVILLLRTENDRLSRQVNDVQTDYRVVNDDYKALIQIMDRARRLAFLSEEEEDRSKFKMDANGNLERMD